MYFQTALVGTSVSRRITVRTVARLVVAREMPRQYARNAEVHHVHQDEDTLDTWFSSALWPFSTLGWPDKTEELDYFYPTRRTCNRIRYYLLLGYPYGILSLWSRQEKFRSIHVLIHGLVRDYQGRKMSKSLGNGIDPLEVIDKYGADALRSDTDHRKCTWKRHAFLLGACRIQP